MSNTVKERIKVDELSKFGFKVGQEYINYSKHIPEADKTNVVPGAEFEAELFVADSGKRYLNKILFSVPSAKVADASLGTVQKAVDTERAKKFTPKFQKKDESATMSKSEWQAKDRSQLIGGLSHDAAAITAAMLGLQVYNNTDEVLKCYQQVLVGMLKIRDDMK